MKTKKLAISRPWATEILVDSFWWNPLDLLKSQAILGYQSVPVPTNALGFRVENSTEMESIPNYSQHGEQIVCLGGSTTFGYYLDHSESWPQQLAELLENGQKGFNVLNLGLVKGDLWQSLRSLADAARHGLRPDVCIFLDGVNQYSGYLQWKSSLDKYLPISPQYWNLKSIMDSYHGSILKQIVHKRAVGFRVLKSGLVKRIPFAIRRLRRSLTIGNSSEVLTDKTLEKFIEGEALLYLSTKDVIERFCKSLGCTKILFMLQPTLFDVQNSDKSTDKYQYLKLLYTAITKRDLDVIDISCEVPGLRPEHFIDWVHTNSDGNAFLAARIKIELSKRGWLG